MNGSVKFIVGRLLLSRMRDLLEQQKLIGYAIRWHESSGLLEHVFTVCGPYDSLLQITQRFDIELRAGKWAL